MDAPRLLVQIILAMICAGIANILIPRKIPGKLVGLLLIGLAGVWFGEWGFVLLRQRFGINYAFLYWNIQGVLIIPAIIGSAVVMYLVTTLLRWGRYTN